MERVPPMISQLGLTQQRILRGLLVQPEGTDVDQLSQALEITPSATRQHLTSLERDGWIERNGQRRTERRPRHLYQLSDAGRELFPRQYALLASQLIESVGDRLGERGLEEVMEDMGAKVALELAPSAGLSLEQLAAAMTDLGYDAEQHNVDEIKALNCVFHHLAARHPQVCSYDLALMETATKRAVTHEECMVRGGKVCRFRFSPPSQRPK